MSCMSQTSVYFGYRIYPLETFEFFCSRIRGHSLRSVPRHRPTAPGSAQMRRMCHLRSSYVTRLPPSEGRPFVPPVTREAAVTPSLCRHAVTVVVTVFSAGAGCSYDVPTELFARPARSGLQLLERCRAGSAAARRRRRRGRDTRLRGQARARPRTWEVMLPDEVV